MNAADVATQLDKRIAAALKATAGTIGPLTFTSCSRRSVPTAK